VQGGPWYFSIRPIHPKFLFLNSKFTFFGLLLALCSYPVTKQNSKFCNLLPQVLHFLQLQLSSFLLGILIFKLLTAQLLYKSFVRLINPLTPELNPSAQSCLSSFLLGILIFKFLTAQLLYKSFVSLINPLTPELNPSAQRCLPRIFTGDFNF
jgi:hypothetical protein